MKQKILLRFSLVLLACGMLTGSLLILAAVQSFDTLAAWLNSLASDGDFEAFTLFLYQIIRLPLLIIGLVMVGFPGFLLIRWKRTRVWMADSPVRLKLFSELLGKDTRKFFTDVGMELRSQGWVVNVSLLVLMLIALIQRLGDLNLPLIHDEAYMYSAFASRSLWHLLSDYHLPNNHVFLSLILHFTTRLFGNSEESLRAPTILTGVLMVPIAYFTAKRFYSKTTALLSAVFVASFPILINYSVYARGYIVLGLFTLILMLVADYVRTNKNRFAWFLVALFSALGFFTIPIMLFSFGAVFIWLFVAMVFNDTENYKAKTEFLVYWIFGGIGAAVLTILFYFPILINNYERFFGNGFIAPLEWSLFGITTWVRVRNTWIEWTSPVWIGFALLGALGLVVSIIFHKKLSRQEFPLQLAFLTWIVLVMLARRPDMQPRFWLFLAAPLLIWSATGIVEPINKIRWRLPKGITPAQVVVGFAVAFVFARSMLTLPSLPAHIAQKDGVEQTAIFMKDYIQEGDLITASVPWLPPLRYYFNYHEVPKGHIHQTGDFKRFFIVVNTQAGETLESVSPKMGFNIPVVDIDSAKVLLQLEDFTVYECYPAK